MLGRLSCGRTFAAGGNPGSALRVRSLSVSRAPGLARQAFSFDITQSDDHDGLVVEEVDSGTQVKTTGGEFNVGHWNTVLGDQELPASGRHYWEVKIVDKPTDAWEYIGVAEKTSDVSVPLSRNRKGKGWFMGSTWSESMLYKWMDVDTKKYQAEARITLQNMAKADPPKGKPPVYPMATEEVWNKFWDEASKEMWNTDGITVGSDPDYFPPLKPGMVVGVDVDMDKGSMSFWANGRYLGPMRDHATNRPVDLKGKKLVPALSVFGMERGDETASTVMEIRGGLEPPPLP